MIDCEQQSKADKFKRLDKRAIGDIIVDRIHLKYMGKGILLDIILVVLIQPSLEKRPVFPFFI